MLRGACGNGDHPDPALFLIIYRLMSTYSLIRAAEGSNVMGEEVLEALLQSSDYVENHDPKKEWQKIKETIIAKSKNYDDFE